MIAISNVTCPKSPSGLSPIELILLVNPYIKNLKLIIIK